MEGLEDCLEPLLVLAAEFLVFFLENPLSQRAELQAQILAGVLEQGQFLATVLSLVLQESFQLDYAQSMVDNETVGLETFASCLGQFDGNLGILADLAAIAAEDDEEEKQQDADSGG